MEKHTPNILNGYTPENTIQVKTTVSFTKAILIIIAIALSLACIVIGAFPVVEAGQDFKEELIRLQKEYAFEEGAIQELYHQKEVIEQRIVVHTANKNKIHEEAELIRKQNPIEKKEIIAVKKN